MLRSCIVCQAGESSDLQLQYCGVCQSALYCSKACQRKDWKEHKKTCKLVNVGHGDMQVRTDAHTSLNSDIQKKFESYNLDEDAKRFFRLFQESTFEGSQAAARQMKKVARRQTKHHQKFLLLYSLKFLGRSDSEMLSWPNSPLLVLLQFVDPNMLSGNEGMRVTPLDALTNLADPFDYSTHEKQLILAKQLIENGANVNAVSIPNGETSLHSACNSGSVTNLDFVQYLLKEGANPNAQDHAGMTPLMYTTPNAPGAAKFLLNWPTTDANITSRSGASFLAVVRSLITALSDKAARPDNPEKVQHQFAIQQWREIEEMLVPVKRGAADTGITTLE
jgi:hypothetical protein